MHRFTQTDFILKLDDFDNRFISLGDGRQDRTSLLLRSIHGGAEEDNDFRVSLGDIFLACGLEISLLSLTIIPNKRAHLAIILGTIRSHVRMTSDHRIKKTLSVLEDWVDGIAIPNFRLLHAWCSEVIDEINAGVASADQKEGSFGFAFDTPVPTAAFAAKILETIEYIDDGFDYDTNDDTDQSFLFPLYLTEKILKDIEDNSFNERELENISFSANLLFLSPPLALVGKQ